MLSFNRPRIWLLLLLMALYPTAVHSQTVYQPVRFQYGQHGEIYYGGTNPLIISNPYLYVPDTFSQLSTVRQSQPSLYVVQTASGPVYLPAQYGPTFYHQQYLREPDRALFSDTAPYTEVGRYGFTVNDAYNEAAANVPLYQAKGQPQNAEAAAPVAPAPARPAEPEVKADPRLKAIPLLNWAKNAHARGETELVHALLQEAQKWDPKATDALRQSFASQVKAEAQASRPAEAVTSER